MGDVNLMLRLHYVPGSQGSHALGHRGRNGGLENNVWGMGSTNRSRCGRVAHSSVDYGEARTRNPSVSSQALYLFLFIHYFKRIAHLATLASLPCGPIDIFTYIQIPTI